jgi:sec-independent protein translocase protein TatC
MPTKDNERPDPEDMFNDTRMSFGDHIEDLRTHLLRAIYGFSIGMVFSLIFLGQPVMRLIVEPLETQLEAFDNRVLKEDSRKAEEARNNAPIPPINMLIDLNKDDLAELLGLRKAAERPDLDRMLKGFEDLLVQLDARFAEDDEARDRILKKNSKFIRIRARIPDPTVFNEKIQEIAQRVHKRRVSTMHITEAFMVYFKIALMTGLVLSSPWVFYHIWMFVAAGLYPHEKKLVNYYLPFSLFLFLAGVVLCQFFVIPRAIGAMLWFNEWLGIGADLRLEEWLGFALMMPLIFGICFQTPLVMMFLHKVGIMTVQTYRDYRRISWFVMAVLAAIFMPTPDAYSMLFLWVPMGLLYELGILLCVWQGEHNTLLDWDFGEEKNELVEV